RGPIPGWRDGNDLHRVHGAESDYYLKLPVPYRARNANIQDEGELLQIRGVTAELYHGPRGRPLSRAEVETAARPAVRPRYPTVPGRFAGRGLTTGSAIFRIEAEGLIGGVSRSQVVAVVRRGRPGRARGGGVLSWRPGAGS